MLEILLNPHSFIPPMFTPTVCQAQIGMLGHLEGSQGSCSHGAEILEEGKKAACGIMTPVTKAQKEMPAVGRGDLP